MILLTGATGFVGSAVRAALTAQGRPFRPVAREARTGFVGVGAISPRTDWSDALAGVTSVIHLAARVHVMRDDVADPLAEFRSTNVDATLRLARQAAQAGVRRFVYASSIKVNGEETQPGRAYRADDAPAPVDPYGVSKAEAEAGLRAIASETGLEVAIVRPPLVYGPGVRANFASIMRLVARGIPLPFGAVTGNRRSLVAVDNLADLLLRCVDHPNAANATFLASDGEDLSTADLLRRLGRALGRDARLLPVPPALLGAAASVAGKRDIARRLLGSLRIDSAPTRAALDWTPPLSVDEGLARAASALRASRVD